MYMKSAKYATQQWKRKKRKKNRLNDERAVSKEKNADEIYAIGIFNR